MKRSLVKLLGVSYLFAATHLMTISCASSDEGGDDEVVAEEGENAADADGNAANEEGNGSNDAEGGNNLGNNGGNAATTNEFANTPPEGGNAVPGAESGDPGAIAEGGTAAPAGGDDNLQQIIEEMNSPQGAAPAQANAAAAPEAGYDNLATNAAAAPHDTATAAAAPAAAGEAAHAAPSAPSAPLAPGLPELGSKMVYIVQKGDTLAKIAQRVYGESNKWTEIADFTGIANPKLIYPGDVVYYQLTEKTTTFATAYEGISRSEVQVGQGDTLATIASKVFGNSSLWKLIWRQNDKIDNPDKLTAGTKIFYLDQSKLAELDKDVSSKFAAAKIELKKDKVKIVKTDAPKSKSKVQAKKTKTIEVANDQVVDYFTHVNSQNLVSRLI